MHFVVSINGAARRLTDIL